MSIIEKMSALCDEIAQSEISRQDAIKTIRDNAKQLGNDANKMLSSIHVDRLRMGKKRSEDRTKFKKTLGKETSELLAGFRKKRIETRKELLRSRNELTNAFGIWRSFSQERKRTSPSSSPAISKPSETISIPLEDFAPAKPELRENAEEASETIEKEVSEKSILEEQPKEINEQIIEAIKREERGLTLDEIRIATGISRKKLHKIVRQLVKEKKVGLLGERYQVISE